MRWHMWLTLAIKGTNFCAESRSRAVIQGSVLLTALQWSRSGSRLVCDRRLWWQFFTRCWIFCYCFKLQAVYCTCCCRFHHLEHRFSTFGVLRLPFVVSKIVVIPYDKTRPPFPFFSEELCFYDPVLCSIHTVLLSHKVSRPTRLPVTCHY